MKNNAKSVRLSDEVLAYIDAYQGNGFNGKFENIILFAMESEKRKMKELAALDAEIKKKKYELQSLIKQITLTQSFCVRLVKLDETIMSFMNDFTTSQN